MEKNELQFILDNADILYDLVMTGADNIHREHNLGGVSMNMVMAHTLTAIAKNPGIRVSDVAQMWGHTLGAASRNVERLVGRGFITKEKRPGNKKEVCLYPTISGRRIAAAHEKQDEESIRAIAEKVFKNHSFEEIKTFFSVMDTVRIIFREENL